MLLGGLFAGWIGVTSALIGTRWPRSSSAITALSILIANRFIGSDLFVGLFFGIVLGGWILKFVLFLVLAVVLRGPAVDQPDRAVPEPHRGRHRLARGRHDRGLPVAHALRQRRHPSG